MDQNSEWLSICCTAESLYNLDILENMDTIGICSYCKEHTSFEKGDETPDCTDCDKPSVVTLGDIPYCVKHYRKAKNE